MASSSRRTIQFLDLEAAVDRDDEEEVHDDDLGEYWTLSILVPHA